MIPKFLIIEKEKKEWYNYQFDFDEALEDEGRVLSFEEAVYGHFYWASEWRWENLWLENLRTKCFNRKFEGPYIVRELFLTGFGNVVSAVQYLLLLPAHTITFVLTTVIIFILDLIIDNVFEPNWLDSV